ncbi:plasmodesmata-located protein 2-like [Bidens hawaiensis]|uniref:plasmodesmata-located protein 2-like n=1 Tax=Bidens hawaiensis TaxID=980011 RepID=UPI00404B8145
MHSISPTFLLLMVITPLVTTSAADNTNLVYKGCAQQTLQDPNGVYSSALSAIFGTLIQQSSKAKFFKTVSGSGQATISGLFQCRGDLTNLECYNCVSRLPILMDKLCGKTVAARLQFLGCYMLYEVAGFTQISGMELLYKTCGSSNNNNGGGNGFEERRDAAFASLESGIESSNGNGGFYSTNYESLYVLGQCQGDLGASDCGECVKNAVQRAEVECGSSVSGQIYLHKCFMSYSYYPNGIPNPKKSSSASGSSYSSSSSSSYYSPSSSSSSETETNTGKTVAIILGGAAGVGFIVIFVLFVKNSAKKHDDY